MVQVLSDLKEQNWNLLSKTERFHLPSRCCWQATIDSPLPLEQSKTIEDWSSGLRYQCETDSAPSPLPKAEITNRTAVYPFSTWPHQSSGSEMTTKEDASRTLQVPQMLIPWSTWQLGDHATRYHYGTNKFHKPTLHWFPEPLVYGWFNPCDYPGRKGHQTGHCSTLWRNFFGDYSDEHRRLDNSQDIYIYTCSLFCKIWSIFKKPNHLRRLGVSISVEITTRWIGQPPE